WSAQWVETCSWWRFVAAVAVCGTLAALFQFFLEVACPHGLQKWAMLQSYSANGFHDAALFYADDLPAFLQNHAEVIEKERPHHFSVNPPGWVMVYGALMNWFADHPRAARAVLDCAPREMGWRLRQMFGARGVPVHEQATTALIAAVSRLLCFLGALPAAWLAAERWGRRASLAAASAVLMLPVEPLFAPRCDTFYPTIALTVLALSHYAWDRRSWLAAALAGLVLGVGTFFSMCFFTIGAFAIFYVAAQWWTTGKRPALAATCAAPLCWLAVVGVVFLAGHNSFATWAVNVAKNREFNQLYRQSYGAWTVVNLLEFFWAIGLPLVVFLAGRLALVRRFDPLLAAWVAVLLLLDLSGTNRGEACRLWQFLMPFAALFAVEWLPQLGRWFRPTLSALLILQALNCVLLDRNLILLTDLEPSRAFQESGIWKLRMSKQGMAPPPVPATNLAEPRNRDDSN
ncbi:MAG TPA: hypothetical protein VFI31_20575, partial [Pirellulales bacterium]|nr:hypothetical protein [Pirellulales bacterium]